MRLQIIHLSDMHFEKRETLLKFELINDTGNRYS